MKNKFRTPLVTPEVEMAFRNAAAAQIALQTLARIANTQRPKRGLDGKDALGLIWSAKAALRKIEEIKNGHPNA